MHRREHNQLNLGLRDWRMFLLVVMEGKDNFFFFYFSTVGLFKNLSDNKVEFGVPGDNFSGNV